MRSIITADLRDFIPTCHRKLGDLESCPLANTLKPTFFCNSGCRKVFREGRLTVRLLVQ